MEEAMKFMGEKLRETFHVLEYLGGEAVARFNGVFPPETRPEKFKRLRLAAENSGAVGLAWLVKAFPPGNRTEKIYHLLDITKPYHTPAAALAVLVILCRFLCRGGGGGPARMMKAPGRNYRMPRAGFESNPKGYFRDLHAGKRVVKCGELF